MRHLAQIQSLKEQKKTLAININTVLTQYLKNPD